MSNHTLTTARDTRHQPLSERADRRVGKAVAGVATLGMVVSFGFALISAFGVIR